MVPILLGWLAIGTFLMLMAWVRITYDYYKDTNKTVIGFLKDSPWDKEHIVALGLIVNSVFVLAGCANQLYHIYFGPKEPEDLRTFPFLFTAVLLGMFFSKAMMWWAKSVDTETHKITWPWWAFVVTLILWALVVAGVE